MSAVAMSNNRWLEVWVCPDTAVDHLLVLRPALDGGCELVDPQNDWHLVQGFDSYESAYYWLTQETYELIDGRHPVR